MVRILADMLDLKLDEVTTVVERRPLDLPPITGSAQFVAPR